MKTLTYNSKAAVSMRRWVSGLGLMLLASVSQAATLDIYDKPLTVGTGKDPNVMFILDSSGSMDTTIASTGDTRMQTVIDATNDILGQMEDVYVGLGTFNYDGSWRPGREGLRVLQNFSHIDGSDGISLTDMTTLVGGIYNEGSTPLGEALEGVGVHFLKGYETSRLTLHDGSGVTNWEYRDGASQIYNAPVEYENGYLSTDGGTGINIVTEPTAATNPIQAWCQRNFVILLTDGIPSRDQDVDDQLREYDGDCTTTANYGQAATNCDDYTTSRAPSGTDIDYDMKTTGNYDYSSTGSDYVDDVAMALYDMNLRPDLCDSELIEEVEDFYGTTGVRCEDLVKSGSVLHGTGNGVTGNRFLEVCDFYELQDIRDANSGTEACDDPLMSAEFQSANDNRFVNNINTYVIGFGGDVTSTQDLLNDTASNGSGGDVTTAFNASDGATLLDSFTEILADVRAKSVGSFATVALNSTSLKNGETSIFFAKYNSDGWTGELNNVEINEAGQFVDAVTDVASSDINAVDPHWEAGAVLDAIADATIVTDRVVFTAQASQNGLEFERAEWTNFTNMMKSDLRMNSTDTDGNPTDTFVEGRERVDFLRGDCFNDYTDRTVGGTVTGVTDCTQYRERDSRLGDIVNSSPVYVGVDSGKLGWPDDTQFNADSGPLVYSDWSPENSAITGTLSRNPVVYVGANDGMLHGFDGSLTRADGGGDEVLAYMPAFLASNNADEGFHHLTESSYDHLYYVDGSPIASDVSIDTGDGQGNIWRTILVGSVRAGGRGIYALDITDPGRFTNGDADSNGVNDSTDTVLWEFSNSDDLDLGLTFSDPVIAMSEKRINGNNQWAVFLGNGYNNLGSGTAKLFVLFIEPGLDGWAVGDYIEIDTGVGSTTTPNGLSTPRVVDTDGDDIADTVYAGDIYGNLWAFNVTGNASAWDSKYGTGVPLLQLCSTSLTADQPCDTPITAQPAVALRDESVDPMVYVGTGMYLQRGDVGDTDAQGFLAIEDRGVGGHLITDVVPDPSDPFGTATLPLLEPRYFVNSLLGDVVIAGDDVDWSVQQGWFIVLHSNTDSSSPPVYAERVIGPPTLRGQVLFVNGIIPLELDECGAGAGYTVLYAVDYQTGLATDEPSLDGNGDGVVDANDQGISGVLIDGLAPNTAHIENLAITATSEGDVKTTKTKALPTTSAGRLSWREIFRY